MRLQFLDTLSSLLKDKGKVSKEKAKEEEPAGI